LPRLAVTAVTLALIGGATAAFTVTEALKLERSPMRKVRFPAFFSPVCECPKRTARLSFVLRKADRLEAEVIDASGTDVRSLESEVEHPAGRLVLKWDGRTDDGTLAPDGAYRLRVQFDDAGRTIVVPDVFRLDTQPPSAELVSVMPRTISPDGDDRRDVATVQLMLGERARPLILIESGVAERGPLSDPGTVTLEWDGTVDGQVLEPAIYLLATGARDRAGNTAYFTRGVGIRIRYVELDRSDYRVRRGGLLRIRVSADVEVFRWTIRHHGRTVVRGKDDPGGVTVRLPRRIEPGRYVLRVQANGHADTAAVAVRPARG
jgi:hypothetical protein